MRPRDSLYVRLAIFVLVALAASQALVIAVIGFVFTFFTTMGATVTMVSSDADDAGVVAFVVAGFLLVGSSILLGVSSPAEKDDASFGVEAAPTEQPPSPVSPRGDDDPLPGA